MTSSRAGPPIRLPASLEFEDVRLSVYEGFAGRVPVSLPPFLRRYPPRSGESSALGKVQSSLAEAKRRASCWLVQPRQAQATNWCCNRSSPANRSWEGAEHAEGPAPPVGDWLLCVSPLSPETFSAQAHFGRFHSLFSGNAFYFILFFPIYFYSLEANYFTVL